MKKLQAFLLVSTLVCFACTAEAAGLAVKRGQANVDASKLPLVCISFGTANIGMPVESMTVISLKDGKKRKFGVSKTFGNGHPDYLTALADKTTLCLLTISLPEGEYQIDSIEYTGGKDDLYDYSFSFSDDMKLKFSVKADVVNFVGSVEFSAPWMPLSVAEADIITRNRINPVSISVQMPTKIDVRETAARDCKWVYDQIPGLRGFKVCLSRIDVTLIEQKPAEPRTKQKSKEVIYVR